jgi:hypothetical protein
MYYEMRIYYLLSFKLIVFFTFLLLIYEFFIILQPVLKNNARSSNGRTSDFGSDYVGSNPARATIKPFQRKLKGFFVFLNEHKLCLMRGEENKKPFSCNENRVWLSINSKKDGLSSAVTKWRWMKPIQHKLCLMRGEENKKPFSCHENRV